MLVYIDESGRFVQRDGVSVVCALTLPHQIAARCKREAAWISRKWPRRDGELKAGLLSSQQLEALSRILFRYDGLLHAVGINVAEQDPTGIAFHKANQADGITKHLAATHSPSFVESVWDCRRALEKMPPQLYLQCVAMLELIWQVVEEGSMYFAQRRPKELGKFEWFIDAKDPTRITPQEKWWRDVIGPLGESRSRDKPIAFVEAKGFDYREFQQAFSMEKVLWHPDHGREIGRGFDIKKVISDRVSFVDSRKELFVQVADILTGFTRRCLAQRPADPMVNKALSRLMIMRRRKGVVQTVQLITLSRPRSYNRHLTQAVKALAGNARAMIKATV